MGMSSAHSTQHTALSKNVPILLSMVVMLSWHGGIAQATEATNNVSPTAPQEQPVKAELITEHASIQPGGQTRIGVHFDIEEGWHIYAKDPGDAGLPTTIAWFGPAGVTFGPLWWPTPEQFMDAGDIHTSGYTGVLVLYSPLKIASRVSADSIPIAATVKWLACKQICVPGSTELHITLPVSATAPVRSTHAELFDQIAE